MKKIIFAAAILSAAVMTGCSLSFDGTDSSQPAENVQGSENAVTTQGTDTESEEAADPLEEAKDVAAMYLKAANAEFDQSMVKLMTDDYAADYEYMKKNMGGDNEYGEDEQISGVRYSFDKDKCGFIDKVNISEEYSKAAELYVTIAYDSSEGEVTSSQYILMVLDKDNDWKVCFAGSKAQAYADGIITDENSEKAEANAQAVYEAAEKAVKELSKDKSYKFEYMNYISTETDKFIEKIKEQLSDELKDTYFTIFNNDFQYRFYSFFTLVTNGFIVLFCKFIISFSSCWTCCIFAGFFNFSSILIYSHNYALLEVFVKYI